MKNISILVAVLILVAFVGIGHCTTATTVSNISGTQPTAGYVIYAKTITASTSGNTEVVAAVTGKKIKVVAFHLSSVDTTNVKFQSAANDIEGSPLWYFIANSNVSMPVATINNQPVILLQTNTGEALNINLSSAKAISGCVLYYTE